MSFITRSHASAATRRSFPDVQQRSLWREGRARTTWRAAACAAAAVAWCALSTAHAEGPRLVTNEDYVRDVLRRDALDVRDPIAVFAFVLSGLAPSVLVYPTENYYYFRFVLNGVPFAGSLRLGPKERDAAKIEFGYYKDLAEWKDEIDSDWHAVLGAAEGVTVERLEGLRYRVAHKGTSVVFELNDLSAVKPPPQILQPGDRYIGPIFDESGVRFFLVYGSRQKVFHYVLDETVPLAEELEAQKGAERLLLGRRTGFAFYRDHLAERKILVGAYDGNSRLNNYFDGPFDQLPENFIEGETLREAIIDSDPGAKGEIDRLGNFEREEGRYAIHPYMLYKQPKDLIKINTCAMQNVKRPETYYRCFFSEPPVPPNAAPLPPPRAGRK